MLHYVRRIWPPCSVAPSSRTVSSYLVRPCHPGWRDRVTPAGGTVSPRLVGPCRCASCLLQFGRLIPGNKKQSTAPARSRHNHCPGGCSIDPVTESRIYSICRELKRGAHRSDPLAPMHSGFAIAGLCAQRFLSLSQINFCFNKAIASGIEVSLQFVYIIPMFHARWDWSSFM